MSSEPHHRHAIPSNDKIASDDDEHHHTDEASHLLHRHMSLQAEETAHEENSTKLMIIAAMRRRRIKLFLAALAATTIMLLLFWNHHNARIVPIERAQEHYLPIPNTKLLKLWYRTWGREDGIPLLFVHGGPGNSVADYNNGNKRFFANDIFFVVEVDQRGTGNSQPSVRDSYKNMKYYTNISIDMIADDYEYIRKELGIEQWLVWGGSYGSTVALTYAIRYPERCSALMLRGIYLESKREIGEVYKKSSYLDNPKRLKEFNILFDYAAEDVTKAREPALDPDDPERIMKVYERMIQRGDRYAAWHWWAFENNLMEEEKENLRNPFKIKNEDYPQAQSVAFFETRLWLHGSYEKPNYILENLQEVRHLPIWICQGLRDEVCPPENAERLVGTLQDAGARHLTHRFIDAGHEDTDPVMAQCLKKSMRDYIEYYSTLPLREPYD